MTRAYCTLGILALVIGLLGCSKDDPIKDGTSEPENSGRAATSLDIGPTDWPQWRFDAGRGAVTKAELPEQLELIWTRQLAAPRPAWPASQPWLRFDESYKPVAAGKMLYVPSMVDDSVTAYDTESGELKWRFHTDGPVRFAPIAAGNCVFFGSDDGYLYCVNGKDGALKWRFRGGPYDRKILGNERLISTWPVRGGPVLKDGTIYFTAGIWPFMGIFVHAVDAQTGKAVWTNSGEGATYTVQPHNSPAFSGLAPRGHLVATSNTLVVPGGRTQPGCYDLATGKFLYFNFGDKGQGSYHVTARDDCYFISGKVVRVSDAGSVLGKYAQVHDADALYTIEGDSLLVQGTSIENRTVEKTDNKGKTTEVVEQFLQELWKASLADAPRRLFLKAGSRFFAGEHGRVAAIEVDAGNQEAKVAWETRLDVNPWSMLAADNKLFVVTEDATIHCYGEKSDGTETREYSASPVETFDLPETDIADARRAIKAAGTTDGIGLVFGLGNGRLADALVAESNLHVIAVDPDGKRIAALRQRMTEAGLYGTRISAHVADPVGYPWPPYLANVVVSGDVEGIGQRRGELLMKSVFNTLRPYGGTACVNLTAESLEAVFANCDLEGARLTADGEDWALLVREGALPGAADWTHDYGDAGKSIVSQDERVKLPLGLLWFGGPSNDEILPRHGHGPSPQVAAGRLFIEGADMLRALDIYTGRQLWQKQLPDLGKYYDNTAHQPGATEIGTNYVSREDSVYVVYGPSLLKLNAQTGETEDDFRLGETTDGTPANWGFAVSVDDLLIATSTPVKVVGGERDGNGPADEASDMTPVIGAGAEWKYLAGTDPADGWTATGFDASAWKTGKAGFGYGDDDDKTVFDDMRGKYERVYLRGTFQRETVGAAAEMTLSVNYDDAFVAYLNGKEIARVGVGKGSGKNASEIQNHEANGFQAFAVRNLQKLLVDGENVVAIEGHNRGVDSSDFTLDPRVLTQEAAPETEEKSSDTPSIAGTLEPTRYSSASRRLVVLDRQSGKELWHRDAEYGFRHNNLAVGDGKLFCIDGLSPKKQQALRRRGDNISAYKPTLLALDVRTGDVIWSTNEDVFGTFLNYSTEHDALLQAGSAARDRAADDIDTGMTVYQGKDGTILWQDLQRKHDGPCMLHGDRIITQSRAYSLLTGEQETRVHPMTGETMLWGYKRNYGCNTVVASKNLLTFRSAAAGFYDLTNDGGTGNFGGFKSSCTSNLIVAGGLLNAPEYTRTCTCRYQNQTSLAMIHDPNVEMWTFNPFSWGDKPIQRVGINFGAPGDRLATSGTLWLDYPSTGGDSPNIPVTLRSDEDDPYFRYHTSHIEADETGELAWVAASGIRGLSAVELTLAKDDLTPRKYTVRLHFAEIEELEEGQRLFDIALQGNTVAENFDIRAEAGGVNKAVVKEFRGVEVTDRLLVVLAPQEDSSLQPILSGIEVVVEK